MSEDRIINLEIRFTHMEDLVAQLNKLVTDQQFIIEKLQKDVTDLKLLNLSSGNSERLSKETPPHY